MPEAESGGAGCYDCGLLTRTLPGGDGRRAEHALLLACAATRPDESAARMGELAGQPLDWAYVLDLAAAHGVTGLLERGLRAGSAPAPAAVIETLERHLVGATAQNLAAAAQLRDIMRLLSRGGITALAFKGPTLAVAAYGHVGSRTFVDLDILVPRSSMPQVASLMLANGYIRSAEDRDLIEGWYPAVGRDATFVPTGPGLTQVEVHAAITTWSFAVRLRTEALLDRAVTVTVAGCEIPTLCPEDLLLVLAWHGTYHEWSGLRFVSEVDAIARGDLDWDAILSRAHAARMLRMLNVAVLLGVTLLDTPVPADVAAAGRRDRHAVRLARVHAARLFRKRSAMDLERGRLRIGSREYVADKVRFLIRCAIKEALPPWGSVVRSQGARS